MEVYSLFSHKRLDKRQQVSRMRAEHLVTSILGLLFSFFLLIGGFLLFLPPFIPTWASALQTLFLNHLTGVSYFGLTLLFLGVFFLTLFAWLNRRSYLLLKMGGVSVKDQLVAHFAKTSIEKLFPGQAVECDVIVRKKKRVEILANLPFVEEKEQEGTLRTIEKELVVVLLKQCQYDQEFTLNVSFSSSRS